MGGFKHQLETFGVLNFLVLLKLSLYLFYLILYFCGITNVECHVLLVPIFKNMQKLSEFIFWGARKIMASQPPPPTYPA